MHVILTDNFIFIGYKEPVGERIFKSEADWIEQLSVVFSLISLKKPKFVYEVA